MLSHCPGGLWVFEENVWANVEDCKRRVSAGINSITVWFFPGTDLRAAPRTSIVLAAFPSSFESSPFPFPTSSFQHN